MHSGAAELIELGAKIIAEFDEPEGHWITMLGPEGNEFRIQWIQRWGDHPSRPAVAANGSTTAGSQPSTVISVNMPFTG